MTATTASSTGALERAPGGRRHAGRQGRLRAPRRATRAPRPLRGDARRGEPGERPGALPRRGGPARVLAERLQRVHAARDHRRVPDHVGVEDARRAVLPAPPPPRRRPRREPRRHRARDPAGRFAEPRIHFAINCGSNGCPPMRPAAYEGEAAARDAARRHRAVPRERVELPRRPRRAARLRLAHLQDVRRGLRRRRAARPRTTGAACSASSPSTPGLPLEDIADYEVVYNVYDWGLNDAAARRTSGRSSSTSRSSTAPTATPSCASCTSTRATSATATCSWCTIDGSPEGWYRAATRRPCSTRRSRTLARRRQPQVLRRRADAAHAGRSSTPSATCRARGFRGLVHGLLERRRRPTRLIDILESDPRQRGGAQLLDLPRARRRAAAAAREGAARGVGRGAPGPALPGLQGPLPRRRRRRARVRSRPRGRLPRPRHAAACAAFRCSPRRDASTPARSPPRSTRRTTTSGASARARAACSRTTARSAAGSTTVLDPAARARGVSSCEMCHRHLGELPPLRPYSTEAVRGASAHPPLAGRPVPSAAGRPSSTPTSAFPWDSPAVSRRNMAFIIGDGPLAAAVRVWTRSARRMGGGRPRHRGRPLGPAAAPPCAAPVLPACAPRPVGSDPR